MANVFKYLTGTPSRKSLKRGNLARGIGLDTYGPTSETGYYAGVNPPEGGYVITPLRSDNKPSYQIAKTDIDLVNFANNMGANVSTGNQAKTFFENRANTWLYSSTPTEGLVLHLDASELASYPKSGNTWYDMSGNDNHGSLINGPLFKNDHEGIIELDGVDDYILVPYSPTTNIRGSLTVSMFAKSTRSTWYPYWNGVSKYNQFILGANGAGEMAFLIYSNTWYPSGYGGAIWGQAGINTPNEWHLYTGTYNQDSGDLKMYVDGVETASFNIGYQVLNNDPDKLEIGRRECCAHRNIDMSLGYTQIYNRALSQDEILQNYNAHKSRFGL